MPYIRTRSYTITFSRITMDPLQPDGRGQMRLTTKPCAGAARDASSPYVLCTRLRTNTSEIIRAIEPNDALILEMVALRSIAAL